MPSATRLFTAHDYPSASRHKLAWQSSVADQRSKNVHVRDGVAEVDFVAMRNARDATLEAPLLILPALQVNIRAGRMPPSSPEGHVYLRLPVNAI